MTDPLFDYAVWNALAPTLQREFTSASPYPHVVLENFVNPASLNLALASFPDPKLDTWIHYAHINERKQGQMRRDLIPSPCLDIIDELSSPNFLQFLETISNIKDLMADPRLEGGGLHQTKKDGFLNIHADFASHPFHPNWVRRLNVLVYLNEDWRDDYGGHFELWDKNVQRCEKKVLPIFNRCVIFKTEPISFHGHPHPLSCPDGRTRKSIALYYFTEETGPVSVRSTEYKPIPTDRFLKKVAISIDNLVLRVFDTLKRKCGFSDRWASSLLKRFFK